MPDLSQRDLSVSCRAGSPDPAVSSAASPSRRRRETPRYNTSFSRALVAALNALIWLYQHTLSPAFAVAAPSCGCRFAPTCSHYAQDALREHGVVTGLGLTLRRLAKCGPWHPGGIDPVPTSAQLQVRRAARKFSCTKVASAAPTQHPLLTAHR